MTVRSDNVSDAISILEDNKGWCLDHLTAEHLKSASHELGPLHVMRFTAIMAISLLAVPVSKDMAGKLNSMDNYQPIAYARILLKVLEMILL